MTIQAPPGVEVKDVKLHIFYNDGDMETMTLEDLDALGADQTLVDVVDKIVKGQKERIWQYAVRILLANRKVIRFTYQIEDNKAKLVRHDEYKE